MVWNQSDDSSLIHGRCAEISMSWPFPHLAPGTAVQCDMVKPELPGTQVFSSFCWKYIKFCYTILRILYLGVTCIFAIYSGIRCFCWIEKAEQCLARFPGRVKKSGSLDCSVEQLIEKMKINR